MESPDPRSVVGPTTFRYIRCDIWGSRKIGEGEKPTCFFCGKAIPQHYAWVMNDCVDSKHDFCDECCNRYVTACQYQCPQCVHESYIHEAHWEIDRDAALERTNTEAEEWKRKIENEYVVVPTEQDMERINENESSTDETYEDLVMDPR